MYEETTKDLFSSTTPFAKRKCCRGCWSYDTKSTDLVNT